MQRTVRLSPLFVCFGGFIFLSVDVKVASTLLDGVECRFNSNKCLMHSYFMFYYLKNTLSFQPTFHPNSTVFHPHIFRFSTQFYMKSTGRHFSIHRDKHLVLNFQIIVLVDFICALFLAMDYSAKCLFLSQILHAVNGFTLIINFIVLKLGSIFSLNGLSVWDI